jgi:hypothetical protein
VHVIDQYQKEIKSIQDHLTPTTPPAVKDQMKEEAITQLYEIEQHVSVAAKFFDKTTQLWTKLEEDKQVQKWDKEEQRINAAIQELKQR